MHFHSFSGHATSKLLATALKIHRTMCYVALVEVYGESII